MPQTWAIHAINTTVPLVNQPEHNVAKKTALPSHSLNFEVNVKNTAAGVLKQYAEQPGKELKGSRGHRPQQRDYTSEFDESSDGEALHTSRPYRGPRQESFRPWKPPNHLFPNVYNRRTYRLYNIIQVLDDPVVRESRRKGWNYRSLHQETKSLRAKTWS